MMTAKKKKFANEWLVDLNATQAAIRAGYSDRTAYQQGHRLLKDVEVQEYIKELREKLMLLPDIATPEEVLRGYTRDIRFDPRGLLDDSGRPRGVKDLDENTRLALAGLKIHETQSKKTGLIKTTYEYKFPDKRATRETLAKHLGWIAPVKGEITGKDGAPLMPDVIFYIPENGRDEDESGS